MIIRRIHRHAITHNWFAVTVDLVIVILGVFLGTQANNWNQARIDANAARTYRARLLEDVRSNETDLRARIAYYSDVRKHALSALDGFLSPNALLGEPFLIDAYQATQVNTRKTRQFTYDEIVAAGDLSSIGAGPVREVAATYYLGLKAIDELNSRTPAYRDRLRREMPYAAQNAIRRVCGDRTRDFGGAVIFTLPASCQTGLEPTLVARAVAQIRRAPEMDRDLSRYIVDLDQKLNSFNGSLRRAVTFRKALEGVDK